MCRFLRYIGRPRLGIVDHLTVPVRDLEAARAFYCGLLGAAYSASVNDETLRLYGRPPAPNSGEGVHHVSVYFSGPTRIDLFLQQKGQPEPLVGHPHFAFRIPPRDLLKWKARLTAAGVKTEGPLRLGPPGQASLYFNDPFGNHLELECKGFSQSIPIRAPDLAQLGGT
jgi:catechol 2,3-dioxygenase-like lactoylglutathione lyase family enzyme